MQLMQQKMQILNNNVNSGLRYAFLQTFYLQAEDHVSEAIARPYMLGRAILQVLFAKRHTAAQSKNHRTHAIRLHHDDFSGHPYE